MQDTCADPVFMQLGKAVGAQLMQRMSCGRCMSSTPLPQHLYRFINKHGALRLGVSATQLNEGDTISCINEQHLQQWMRGEGV